MARTIQELTKEALAVQDACNLCGVAQSFARAMSELMDMTGSTKKVNEHFVTILWLDKMASLAGIQELGNEKVMEAYREARNILKGA